jgi:hypothetical protein
MKIFDMESSLDTSGVKFVCPKCGKKTFTKYVYKCNEEFVGDQYGYCNRGWYCKYKIKPSYNFFENDNHVFQKELYGVNCYDLSEYGFNVFDEGPEKFTHTIPEQFLLDSMNCYDDSNFAKFLIKHLDRDALKLLTKYYVGLSRSDDKAANIFWKIDDNFIVRNGVIAYYSSDYGCKYEERNIDYIYNPEIRFYTLFSCFFGTHLINLYPDNEIAIVEDEKTAIVCSHFWPEFNWLATGELERLHWREYQVYNALRGKNVTFYSDYKKPILESSTISEKDWIEMKNYIENEIFCKIEVKSLFGDKINTLDEANQDLVYQLLKMPRFN